MAGLLHGVFVGEWLFVFPLCGFSLSLFCNYLCPSHATRSHLRQIETMSPGFPADMLQHVRIRWTHCRQICCRGCSACDSILCLPRRCSLRLLLFCTCPPLCGGALWPMPAWVWCDIRKWFPSSIWAPSRLRVTCDVRFFFSFFSLSQCLALPHPGATKLTRLWLR